MIRIEFYFVIWLLLAIAAASVIGAWVVAELRRDFAQFMRQRQHEKDAAHSQITEIRRRGVNQAMRPDVPYRPAWMDPPDDD